MFIIFEMVAETPSLEAHISVARNESAGKTSLNEMMNSMQRSGSTT